MAQITLGNTVVRTAGELPLVGSAAPDFLLVTIDLKEVSLKTYAGKTIVLNIFPSIDTNVCAASVREFNLRAAALQDTVVLSVAKDLPFAMKRFCGTDHIDNVIMLSDFRNKGFTKAYGVELLEGHFAGLMARAIVVIDKNGKIKYTELVPAIDLEPDYDAALDSL